MFGVTTTHQKLRRLGVCKDALAWVGDRDLEEAWRECPSGDWMVWLVFEVGNPTTVGVLRAAIESYLSDPTAAELLSDHLREVWPSCPVVLL